jgi:fucose 4-O-acetylase-like acetyltransferase
MISAMSALPEPPRTDGRRRTFLDAAARTPATRDRYVDFLRAFSICVVVLGHWLIAIVYIRDGRIQGVNALHVIPGLWIATWILQVMPLFFFVGGFSNLVTLDSIARKGGSYSDFISSRVNRLLRPTSVLLAVWIPLAILVDLFAPFSDRVMEMGTELLTRPLWFLGVYLIMIALAPTMLKLHRRFGFSVLIAMAIGAILVDIGQFGFDLQVVGSLNYLFVWLFAHQLGFFYAEKKLLGLPPLHYLAMAAGGLLLLVLLTTFGPYASSMVGLTRERSNTNPPTLCILVLTIWQVGLAMLLRGPVSRVLSGQRAWAGVIALNAMIMTMFLWHQTALLIAVGILYPLGFPQPEAGTAAFWLLRPVWVLALATVLAVLIAIFGRFERGSRRSARKPGTGAPRPVAEGA